MIIKNIKKAIKLSKSGKPYASVAVQFEEYKDGKGNLRWISGFGNKKTWAWKVGDDVNPNIEDKGKYLNFEYWGNDEANRLDVYRLPATIGFVMELLKFQPQANSEGVDDTSAQDNAGGSQVDDDEINPDDIPF